MSGDWDCYGWSGTYCHTGTNFFASDTDGLCFKNTDQDYIPEKYPFDVYFAAHHVCTSSTLNRKVVEFFNGEAFYSFDVENKWKHVYDQLTINNKSGEGLYTFQLQDGDGNVLCERSVNLGEETIEPEPPLPAQEDYTDYARIKKIVGDRTTLAQLASQIGIRDIKSNISEVDRLFEIYVTSFNNLFNRNDGYYRTSLDAVQTSVDNIEIPDLSGLSTILDTVKTSLDDLEIPDISEISDNVDSIKVSVDNITFPDLTGLSKSVEDVKKDIVNIKFPDLTGLSTTLGTVKTSLDDLTFPSLSDISTTIDYYKIGIYRKIAGIHDDIITERKMILPRITSDTTLIKDAIIKKIDDIDIEIPDITFPNLSFITDGFTSVESKINGLEFPTLDGIEEKVVNAADTIADKILDRILDVIERRYNK